MNMQKTTWRSAVTWLDALSMVALLAAYLIGAWAIATRQPHIWVDQIYDDAYYYLGVVRSLAEGHGSQFLPPFKTNGYQPLWTVLLWLIASIVGTGAKSLALQIYTCSYLGAFAFALLSKRYLGNAFIAVAYSLSFPYVNLLGMETCLIPPLFLLFMNSRGWAIKGTLGSLIFLSRLDGLALVVAQDAVGWLRGKDRDLRHYFVVVPVLLAYFALNQALFGTPVPISGLAKAVGNVTGENWGPALQYLVYTRYALILGAVAIGAAVMCRPAAFPFKQELLSLLLTLLMCMGYYSLKSGWPIWGWYAWPAFLLTFYLAQAALQIVLSPASPPTQAGRMLRPLAGVLATLAFAYSVMPSLNLIREKSQLLKEARANQALTDTFGRKNVELAAYFEKALKPTSMVAMGDRAGSLGFFLGDGGVQMMHTEGLVGPYAYVEAMKQDKGKAFVEALPIDYFIVDREKYIENDDVIGVMEPSQGLSSHVGPYLLCFPRSSSMLDQQYGANKRYVFDFKKRTACPAEFEQKFQALRDTYQGIRKYSLPSRYEAENVISKVLHRHIDVP